MGYKKNVKIISFYSCINKIKYYICVYKLIKNKKMKNFKELERAIINQQKLSAELKDKYKKAYKEFKLSSLDDINTMEVMLSNSQIEYRCAEAILESLQDAMKKLQEIEKNI